MTIRCWNSPELGWCSSCGRVLSLRGMAKLKLFSSACRSANIDLVLLIDGSKSVRPQNFELVKKFVNQVGNFFSYGLGLRVWVRSCRGEVWE